MPKLFLPFFIISIFTGKSEITKINPNIATFEELFSIPILTEEEAIAIISLRNVKEFKSTSELIERTGIDSTKTDFLQEIFVFENEKKYHIQLDCGKRERDFNSLIKLTSQNWFTSFHKNREFLGFYLGNGLVTLGKFDLQISPYTLNPVFYSKGKGSYNLCLVRPFIAAFGMRNTQIGLPLAIKPFYFSLSPVIFYKGKVHWQMFAKSSTKPVKLYAYLSTLEQTGVVKLLFSDRNTNFSAQAKVSDKKLILNCSITKNFKTSENFHLNLSNKEFNNTSYLEYSKNLSSVCAIKVGATLSSKHPELYSVRVYSKNLSIYYLKGQSEKVSLNAVLEPVNLRLHYYPRSGSLEYMLTTNLAIRSTHFKIAFKWKNEKTWNLSLDIDINAKKRQSDNFMDG